MTRQLRQMAALGLALSCGACVMAPMPVAMQPACRTFTRNITVDGKDVAGTGVACPQPDGSWKEVAAPTVAPPSPPDAAVPPPGYAVAPPYDYYGYPPPYVGVSPWYFGSDIEIGGGRDWGGGRGWGGGGRFWSGGRR